MKTNSRIKSIQATPTLDSAITGIPTFDLSLLQHSADVEFALPNNLRLGHLAEKIFSNLVNASTNYKVLYENIQIIEVKNTVGEIDFILEDLEKKESIHVELAYKFYLFDPSISQEPLNNWIGPNRNDSLKEKLEKLKRKQFPLLYHNSAKLKFADLEIDEIAQALCLLVNLFVPLEFKTALDPLYQKAVNGYYINLETFKNIHRADKRYYLPSKIEWGMEASENDTWSNFDEVEEYILICMQEKKAPLCWQKHDGNFATFFIVWW